MHFHPEIVVFCLLLFLTSRCRRVSVCSWCRRHH